MDALFEKLAGGAAVSSEILSIKGRDLRVPVTAQDIARISFSDVCERPLGAEDYLQLAGAYHTLFLENVPRMGYDRHNEAKRFMILIDSLYEQGVKLVISAETAPEKLYTGREHAFEFKRTISRLHEMRGADYLRRRLP